MSEKISVKDLSLKQPRFAPAHRELQATRETLGRLFKVCAQARATPGVVELELDAFYGMEAAMDEALAAARIIALEAVRCHLDGPAEVLARFDRTRANLETLLAEAAASE